MNKVSRLNRIEAFQGLRAVAIFAIFIQHTEMISSNPMGAWGVSVFFVLSGFLMMYNYLQRDYIPKFGLLFVWKKIKKLYPLHLVTMILGLIYELLVRSKSIKDIIIALPLHTFLLQSWSPKPIYISTLNGVSWYLSTSVFLYFCFPLILRGFRKIKYKKTVAIFVCGGGIAAEIMVAVIAGIFFNKDMSCNFSVRWFTYFCPLTRLLDFFIGCCMGNLFLYRKENKYKKRDYVILEIFTVICIFISFIVYKKSITVFGTECVRNTLLFLPTTMALIWLTAVNKGWLQRIFESNIMVTIGNYSPFIFLIHVMIIRYSRTVIQRFLPEFSMIIITFFSWSITMVVAIVWDKFYKLKV